MGLRFHKSLRLIPGLRLNLSKSGPSLSVGGKGLTCNIGSKGSRTTVGLPGLGLSYTTTKIKTSLFWIVAVMAYVTYLYASQR